MIGATRYEAPRRPPAYAASRTALATLSVSRRVRTRRATQQAGSRLSTCATGLGASGGIGRAAPRNRLAINRSPHLLTLSISLSLSLLFQPASLEPDEQCWDYAGAPQVLGR